MKVIMSWLFKACVRYFSLFLKDKCIFSLVRTKYNEKKFTLQLLFLPTVSRTFILSWATTRYPPPWNFLFRKNNCMCNRDNACHVVQMNKARREVNRTNQVQTKINIVKGLQTSVIHLLTGSTCHWISNRMRYFQKISFGGRNIFKRQLIAEGGIRGCFLWNLFSKFHKFLRRTLPVSVW